MAKRRRGPTLIQQSRRKSPAEKAAYHNYAGAGRSHVKRRFFELNASDETAIVDRIQAHLTQAVREA